MEVTEMKRPPHSNCRAFRCLTLMLYCMSGMLLGSQVFGQSVVAEYLGGENPLQPKSGGQWSSSGRASFGKAVGEPVPAWRIQPDDGQALSYGVVPTDAQIVDIFQNGWRMTARVRLDTSVVASPKKYSAAFGIESAEQNAEWQASVVIDESGSLSVEVNRTKHPLPGLAISEYHTYEMVCSPGAKVVQLLVDGQAVGGDIKHVSGDKTRIFWGNTSIQAPSAAEWASVKFEILKP